MAERLGQFCSHWREKIKKTKVVPCFACNYFFRYLSIARVFRGRERPPDKIPEITEKKDKNKNANQN